jgi:hypothetical protein
MPKKGIVIIQVTQIDDRHVRLFEAHLLAEQVIDFVKVTCVVWIESGRCPDFKCGLTCTWPKSRRVKNYFIF